MTTYLSSITISYPNPLLNPNKRPHWAVKARLSKAYFNEAYYESKNKKISLEKNKKYFLDIHIRPPDRRRRDDDNIISSLKSARDGLAHASGIDDNGFITGFISVGEVVKGGSITIGIRECK